MFVVSLCLLLLNKPQPHFINLLFRATGTAFTAFLILDSNMELDEKTHTLSFKFGSTFCRSFGYCVRCKVNENDELMAEYS